MTSKYLASTITNYVETIRTNVNIAPQGLQTCCLELDEIGMPISYTEDVMNFYGWAYFDFDFDFSTIPNRWIEQVYNGYIMQIGRNNGQSERYINGVYGAPYPIIPDDEPYVIAYYSIFPNYDLYNRNGRYIYLQGVLQW